MGSNSSAELILGCEQEELAFTTKGQELWDWYVENLDDEDDASISEFFNECLRLRENSEGVEVEFDSPISCDSQCPSERPVGIGIISVEWGYVSLKNLGGSLVRQAEKDWKQYFTNKPYLIMVSVYF